MSVTEYKFDDLVYKKFRDFDGDFYIQELIGFDTEAFDDGKPFLYCSSEGKIYQPRNFYRDIFLCRRRRVDFAVWNLRYDAGAILQSLSLKDRVRLIDDGEIEWRGYKIKYVPHKLLRISLGKMVRNFWDVMPFYHSSLDNAAETYLGENKMVMDTKKFSRAYVKKHRRKLIKYCTRDAVLTARLANHLLKYLKKFDIYPRTLYSTASISFQYFKQHCGHIDVWRFWKRNKELLRYACESYHGGKFEITARGSFTGYEYDISSAYGSEIAALKNIRYGTVYKSRKFQKTADYGFLRVKIDNPRGIPHPVTYKRKLLNIYPAGKWKATITKEEYSYLVRHQIGVKIVSAYWIKLGKIERPFRREVAKLYKIKEQYRTRDKMVSLLAKTMINSLYGKFVQITEEPDGTLKCGIGWNPIYGAVITANMRIRLSELQQKLGRRCVAVHTDSILTTEPMPKKFCRPGLGNWTLKESGPATVIMCGVFQVGDKCANRGFGVKRAPNWRVILEEMGDRSTFKIDQTRVLSWSGQTHLGKDDGVNLFIDTEKIFDVNKESKRIWPGKTNGSKLLAGLEFSSPPVVMER